MTSIRILVADDHPVFRYGMRALLQTAPEMELVGEASSGDEAVSLAAAVQPDVILMDLTMPGIDGIEATRQILAVEPGIGILVVTMMEDDDAVFAAMRAGARGFILKGADGVESLRAIRAVANGEAIFSPTIARRLIEHFAAPPPPGAHATRPPVFPDLTEREHEVLDLVAQGYTNTAIAARLFLSPKTVANHVSIILGKLQVSHRAEAIVRAREAGLGLDRR
jgi:DNA-binding NarL/FixJ family response regulator